MTKVTIKPRQETPAQEVLAKANEALSFVDALGRTITIKKPGVLAQYRLIEALGDAAKNETYRVMVLPLLYVTAIGDIYIPPPKTKLEVEALIQQLDEEGIQAVMEHVSQMYGASDPEKDRSDLKK